ncbi:MAG TPA: hypothetical protein VNL71_02180, partial [Chloroflexota bacterium]|nr:hypothetical protein [Chloroflexota bacterium]
VAIEGKLDAPSVYTDAQGTPQASLRVVTFAVSAAPLPVQPAPAPTTTPVMAGAGAAFAEDDSNDPF